MRFLLKSTSITRLFQYLHALNELCFLSSPEHHPQRFVDVLQLVVRLARPVPHIHTQPHTRLHTCRVCCTVLQPSYSRWKKRFVGDCGTFNQIHTCYGLSVRMFRVPTPGLAITVGLPAEFVVHLHRLNKVFESKYFLSVESTHDGSRSVVPDARLKVHDPALRTCSCFSMGIGPELAAPAP